MADLLKVEDLEKAKKHDTFHSEVITGKTGGLSGGADIDYATNDVTGQVQKTLPKTVDDLDWTPVGTFAAGVTFTKSTDFAVDASGNQWIYAGASTFPVVVAPGTAPSEPDYKIIYSSDYGELPNGRVIQHRRGSSAEIAAYTLADGEVIKNDDDGTLHVGDGVAAGGVKSVNEKTLGNYTDLVFSAVADMQQSDKIKQGQLVKTSGRLTPDDGQGGVYLVQTLADFGGTPDGIVDYASTVDANLVFFNIRIKDTQPTAYAKDFKRFTWGNEYLYALTRELWQSATTAPKCVFSGDSTTAGVFQVGEPNTPVAFKPDIVMDRFARYYGTPITAINAGHSGETTVQWNATRVDQDIANHPDMTAYFARWGINDASIHGDPSTYEAALDAGLAKLRAFKNVTQLSIILMMPNNIYDPDHGRTAAWMEKIVDINYRMAQKHLCYFFDTYAFIRDVVNGGGYWIDAPEISGESFGHIHPSNEHNMWTYSKLAQDVLLPGISAATNVFQSFPTAYRDGLFTRAPNAFENGVTLERATAASGWPADGMVKTTRHPDGNIIQELYGFQGSRFVRQFRFGIGSSGSWQGTFTGSRLEVTLETGWSSISGFVPLSYSIGDDGWVTLEGACTFGSLPTPDSTVGYLPVGFRPSEIITVPCASGDSSSTYNVFGAFNISPNGRISFAAGGDTGNIQMSGARFKAV